MLLFSIIKYDTFCPASYKNIVPPFRKINSNEGQEGIAKDNIE